MILKYVIKNNSDSDVPLELGEAWQFVCHCDDEHEAYVQIEKVKLSAQRFGHDVMNVYLDDTPFDARSWWTEGANADDFPYDESVVISSVQDETKL
jgi:hypothetical protein